MITVSAGILERQQLATANVRRVVAYRRRYWDIDAQAFVYEADWQAVADSNIKSVSKTKEELDAVKLNEFRVGSLTVILYNAANEWQERKNYGRFAKDSAARLGYTAYRTLFKVAEVYVYEDGTESEEVRLFTGYVSAVAFNPDDKTAQFSLDASHILLDDVDAERYSTQITGEIIGIGDGVTTDFYTAQKNVGRIQRLFLDGLLLAQGTDYTVSDTCAYDTQAKISFAAAPTTGKLVKADYFCWHTGLEIAEAVNGLLDLAGIPDNPASRYVEPVTFPYRVIKRLDYAHTDGLRYDCSDLPENVTPAWNNYETTGSATANVSGNVLNLSSGSTSTAGSKKWSISTGAVTDATVFSFYSSVLLANTESFGAVNYGTDGSTLAQAGIISDGAGNASLAVKFGGTTLWSAACGLNQTHGFCIYHQPGRFVVFIDGILRVNYTYTPGTLQTPVVSFGATLGAANPVATNATFQIINLCGDFGAVSSFTLPLVGTKLYPVMDFTESIKAFCGLSESAVLPADSAVSFKTQTSADNSTWNALVSVQSGQIASPALRYGRLQITRQTSASGQELPLLTGHGITYGTLTTKLRMADCTGYSVLDAITELANIASYIFGFDRAGKFFFKSRINTITEPAITLRTEDIVEISAIPDGLQYLYNKIVSAYGNYQAVVEPSTFNSPQPDSQARYGVRQLRVGSSQLLIEQDADIATGTAYSYFQLFSRPRKQYSVTAKFLPQIEAGDLVRLQYLDEPPQTARKWHIGDSAAHIGQANIGIWSHEQQSAYEITGIALSVAHDDIKKRTELVLQEL